MFSKKVVMPFKLPFKKCHFKIRYSSMEHPPINAYKKEPGETEICRN